jgi:RimJ/RimL family protein N-acetyltransferase
VSTERLVLRPWQTGDFEAIHAIHSSAEVTRFIPWGPRGEADTRATLARRAQRRVLAEDGDGIAFAVALRDGADVIGELSLTLASREHEDAEIGFLFLPDHHGRGYGSEAVRALIALAFEGVGLHRVHGRADSRNTASLRLMERLGMRREAHFVENERLEGEWTDEVVYGMLRREWRG